VEVVVGLHQSFLATVRAAFLPHRDEGWQNIFLDGREETIETAQEGSKCTSGIVVDRTNKA
jgi:hypothetical protein